MALVDSLVVLAVGVLIGALGIYVGARVIADFDDYGYAVGTAVVGAVVWAVVAFFFGWIPLLGPALALAAYILVINSRYPGGWTDAVGISLVAWIAALGVLYLLAAVGVSSFEAVGVPGV